MTTRFKSADGTEWVLVPKVATEDMLWAFYHTTERDWDCGIDVMGRSVYAAMRLAAPQPPVEEMVEMMAGVILDHFNANKSANDIARAIVKRLVGDG